MSQRIESGEVERDAFSEDDEPSSKKQASSVWDYVTRIDDQTVKCLLCNHDLKCPTNKISNLHKHACIKAKKKEDTRKYQTTLGGKRAYGDPLGQEEKNAITNNLVKWLVGNEQPFAVVLNDHFKDFVYTLNGRYKVPCPKTIKKWMTSDWNRVKEKMRILIPKLHSFCVTFDTFVDGLDNHYLGLILVYWDPKSGLSGSMKSKLLAMKEVSDVLHLTGNEIAKKIKELLLYYGIKHSDVFVFTADARSNGKFAIEKEMLGKFFHCIPHRVQLSAQKGLATPGTAKLLVRLKGSVTFVNQSNVCWSS